MIDRGERGIDAGRMNGCYTGQAVGPFGSNMNYVDLTRTSWMGNAQGLELSTEWFVEALHCWLQWKAEECEGLMLDRGWSGRHGKCIVWCDCGDDSIAPQGSEIGRQRVEAVHWQAVVGQAGGRSGRWSAWRQRPVRAARLPPGSTALLRPPACRCRRTAWVPGADACAIRGNRPACRGRALSGWRPVASVAACLI